MATKRNSTVKNKNTLKNSKLTPQQIEGYSSSVTHHSNIVQTFSSKLVNIFALYNAGGFAASVSIISTSYGQAALAEMRFNVLGSINLFITGFGISCLLMILLLQYSSAKYDFYRNILKENKKDVPFKEGKYLGPISLTLLTLIILSTCAATYLAVQIIIKTPTPSA